MLGEPHGDPVLTLFAIDEGGANGLLLCAGGANGLTAGPDRLRRSSLGLMASDVGEPAPKGSADCWLIPAVVAVLNGFVVELGGLPVGDSFNFCSCQNINNVWCQISISYFRNYTEAVEKLNRFIELSHDGDNQRKSWCRKTASSISFRTQLKISHFLSGTCILYYYILQYCSYISLDIGNTLIICFLQHSYTCHNLSLHLSTPINDNLHSHNIYIYIYIYIWNLMIITNKVKGWKRVFHHYCSKHKKWIMPVTNGIAQCVHLHSISHTCTSLET